MQYSNATLHGRLPPRYPVMLASSLHRQRLRRIAEHLSLPARQRQRRNGWEFVAHPRQLELPFEVPRTIADWQDPR